MGRDRANARPAAPAATEPPKPAPPPAERTTNKPVHEDRLGRIKAAVWANTGEGGVWYSVVFSRLYKEGDAWKRSESFGRDDLPLVMKVADLAHSWIYEQGSGERGQENT